MIYSCRYHLIRYWAQAVILKHYQTRDETHALLLKYCRIMNNAQNVLSKQYCENVYSSINFLSRIAPLNFIKKWRADETRCIIVWCSILAKSIILSPEWICAQAINPFLTTRQKEPYFWCEVGLFSRTKQQHCSEVIKNEIHEVACA
ncbi:MAG: hypothetical protein Q7V05_11305 [Methanoregula sp.]|nr:hypothetical protein [Methanoregula sp.]